MCEDTKIRIYRLFFISRVVQSLEKGIFFQLYENYGKDNVTRFYVSIAFVILNLKFVHFTLTGCIYFNL